MKRRLLAISLSLCLVMGILSTPVFAASDDLTPPVVKSISMNSPGGTVTVGDTLYFDVEVEDESDVTSGWLDFYADTTDGRNSVATRFVSYDSETHIAKMALQIQNDIPSGVWCLNSVYMCDYYGNSITYRKDYSPGDIAFDDYVFTVSETAGDLTPPVVKSIFMNNPGGTVTIGDTLYFDVEVEDESDITSGWLDFYADTTDGRNSVSTRFVSYDSETHIAKVTLQIQDNIPSGVWRLNSVYMCDYYGKSITYRKDYSPGEIVFDDYVFTVSETAGDLTPPVVKSISMSSPGGTVIVGDTLYFDVEVEDESDVTSGWLDFYADTTDGRNSVATRFVSYDSETHIAKMTLQIQDNIPSGVWRLNSVYMCDYYGNSITYRKDYSPGEISFDNYVFTVANTEILPDSVSIPDTIEVRVRDVHTLRPTVTPATSVPKWVWTSADTSIAEAHNAGGGTSCNVTGVAPGMTTITGTTQNGLTVACEVTVTDAPMPEGGTANELYHVGVGGYVDIAPVLTPANATTLYEVTSANPHVAGIGTTAGHTGVRIEGNNPGTATITIRGANNLVMTTTVKVGNDSDRQHEKTTVAGYAPTCTREGRTDAVRCSACWYMFTEAQAIPATGHSFGGWTTIREATATETGLRERICENCGYRETETIPATGGSSSGGPGDSGNSGSSGGSGGSGGGGHSDGASSNPSSSTNQTVTVTANDQSIEAAINGGTAEVFAAEKRLAEIIENASVEGTVKIDVSSIEKVSEVSIPQDIVKKIHDSESVSGLSVITQNGSVEMSEEALQTVSNALTGDNDHIAIKVDTIDINTIPATQKYPIANVLNSAVFVELSASVIHKDGDGNTTSTEAIHEFNGEVTVSVPYERPANMEGRQIIACYTADDGAVTYFPVKYENGIATFTTTHFSTFAVLESCAASFLDVDIGAWYMLGVEYALQNSLMGGYNNESFGPNDNLSRAQLAQILYNKEGKPTISGSSIFTDVAASAWYSDAVIWAAANNIVGGYGNGQFGPDDNITREQLAVMLWQYSGSPAATNKELRFNDVDQISGYAVDALRWAVENGIVNGYGDGRLGPKSLATRAQVAQMLKNYLER